MSPTSGMIRAPAGTGTAGSQAAGRSPPEGSLVREGNVQLLKATSAWPVANASAPGPDCRKVTTDSRLTTPAKMVAASRTRAPTKPRRPLQRLLTTGYSTTAVPMQAKATITSSTAPTRMEVSAGAEDVVRIVPTDHRDSGSGSRQR